LVQRTAALARLDLSAAELGELAPQFGRILEQFAVLAQLDVDAVEPMRGRARDADVVRADRPAASLDRRELLERAPEAEDGFYAVPKTVLRPGAGGAGAGQTPDAGEAR
jgi:aspartyl-tRNA(Asn)/glutamyl-tRNA(Gln) amidotransferase subunit C